MPEIMTPIEILTIAREFSELLEFRKLDKRKLKRLAVDSETRESAVDAVLRLEDTGPDGETPNAQELRALLFERLDMERQVAAIVGWMIFRARERMGLSQRDFGILAGQSARCVERWEQFDRIPSGRAWRTLFESLERWPG